MSPNELDITMDEAWKILTYLNARGYGIKILGSFTGETKVTIYAKGKKLGEESDTEPARAVAKAFYHLKLTS